MSRVPSLLLLLVLCVPLYSQPMKPDLGSVTNRQLSISDGLVGYWPMLSGVGPVAYDASGNNRNGTITSGVWGPSSVGTAIQFDGVATKVSLTDCTPIEGSSAFTFSVWAKTSIANNTILRYIAAKAGGGTDTITLAWDNVEAINARVYAGGSYSDATFASGIPLNHPDIWYHIVLVYDGAYVTIWVNGVSGTPSARTGTVTASLHELTLGSLSDGTPTWSGCLDSPAVWSRALTAAEISLLYSDRFVLLRNEQMILTGPIPTSQFVPKSRQLNGLLNGLLNGELK
jgi:hypothetical protein